MMTRQLKPHINLKIITGGSSKHEGKNSKVKYRGNGYSIKKKKEKNIK